jgi:predicted peroxiredoxin
MAIKALDDGNEKALNEYIRDLKSKGVKIINHEN